MDLNQLNNLPRMSEEDRSKLKDGLQDIVDDFNDGLKEWTRKSGGCQANFGWKYQDGKGLIIQSIDLPVYRNEPPSGQTLKDLVDKERLSDT